MEGRVTIPASVWHEVRVFFNRLATPCKECVRGNSATCWHSECAVWKYRDISARVLSAGVVKAPNAKRPTPKYVEVENEVLRQVRQYGRPVYPSMVVLSDMCSKAVKSATIDRLVKQGRLAETRVNDYTRLISIPSNTKQGTDNEQ